MNKLSRSGVVCLGVLVSIASASTFAEREPALPTHFGSWTGTAAEAPPAKRAPALQQEVGEGTPEAFDYVSGGKKIHALLRKYKDPSAAYEAYTLELQPGMQPSDIRKYSAVAPDHVLMLIGNFVLDVDLAKNISTPDLRTLAQAVESHATGSPLPPIRAYLPEDRLVQGTQRYALGTAGFKAALASLNEDKFSLLADEIGFASGAEAILGRYQVASNKSQALLIVDYPTPQIAEQRLRHIQPLLASNPALSATTVERKASLLSLVLSPVSAESASKLREAINYETQVTWSEPSQTLTDPPWLLVVKDIFVGTLAFCGIAIVLGIAFGGVRVLTKRFFPGKVFDRPEDMEVLQLGLSGKRIDPTDFY
jgi:hypothetical protein